MIKSRVLVFMIYGSILIGCSDGSTKKSSDASFSEKGEDFFNSTTETETEATAEVENKSTDKSSSARKSIASITEHLVQAEEQSVIYDYDNESLYLAVTQLCWNADYEKAFGYERTKVTYGGGEYKNGEEKIEINNSCLSYIPAPYVSPMEYYYHLFHGYNEIRDNRSNVFKLKELRNELHQKEYQNFKKKVFAIDHKNIISFTMSLGSIQNYDFEKKRLFISYSTKRNASIKRKKTIANIQPLTQKRQISYAFYIPMQPEEANAIYEFYPKYNSLYQNPPFPLITKTTYSVSYAQKNVRPFLFDINIKKIEFFKKQGDQFVPENKIGEVTF